MANRLVLLCIVLTFSVKAMAQSYPDPIAVVQQQLDAYNAQDLDAFTAVFAEDAEVFVNQGDTVPSMVGRAEIKKRYGAMFEANPTNKSTLIGRMVQGNFVFDHEWITGRDNPFKIVAIYEVKEGFITRCWFAR